MQQGTVKFWSSRGFGFLRVDDAPDVFVHAKIVTAAGYSALTVGQRVSYTLGIDARSNKEAATSVTLLDPVISPAKTYAGAGDYDD
jgi:cold shock CspA family protein